ncbi:MAG: hypothetical protein O2964_05375 [Verrucomicrobia bacterium]|nr:hypothetical protein [Verrucomicrobiota bacterium]
MNQSLSEATLLLAFHGASDDPRPAQAGQFLASKLKASGMFGDVLAGFYKHAPFMNDQLNAAKGRLICVLPMLMSEGFFARKVFPGFLNLAEDSITNFPHILKDGKKTIVYTKPLGSLPGMFDLILQSVEATLKSSPPKTPVPMSDINIALIGHGTPRHSQSKETTQELAEALDGDPRCGAGRAFFIEEPPFVKEVLDWQVENRHCVVVPFMAADGPHAIQDIPIALGQPEQQVKERVSRGEATWINPTLKTAGYIWTTPPIGLSPLLPDLIIRHLTELTCNGNYF